MSLIRRRLSRLLAGWIVAQLSIVAAPVVHAAAHAALTEALCTCGDGAHSTSCPMHHDRASDADGARCVIQCAGGPTDLMPVSLSGGAGVMPQPIAVDVPTFHTPVAVSAARPIVRADLPDSPPPRA